MPQYLIITEEEIKNNPNDYELGKLVRMKYIEAVNKEVPCPICGAEKRCTPDEKNCEK